MEKMRNYIFIFKEKTGFQDIYPNIIYFCTDLRTRAGDYDGLADLIATSQIPKEISALATWKLQEITCCLKNPCAKKLELESISLKKFFKL